MDYKNIIIAEFNTLIQNETINKQVFKVRAYQKIIKQIKQLDKINVVSDLNDICGIGEKSRLKLEEIFETGKLKAAEKARKHGNLDLYNSLMKIHGVGATKAKQLVEYGINSIDELKLEKNATLLNNQQKIGLKYYNDINIKIPRKEMIKHDTFIQDQLKSIDSDILISIVGSYRRQVKESGDIDMLISINRVCSQEYRTTIMCKIIDHLKHIGYIKDSLALGNKKYMGVVKLKRFRHNRRMDILITSIEEYAFATLYFTGSAELNIILRQIAIDKGMRLNEYSLTKKDKIIKLKSEKEIFKKLGYNFIPPENRSNQKNFNTYKF